MDLSFIPPKETRIRFSLEPAYNAVCSLSLINEDVSGCDDWVEQTAARLSPEQAKTNEVAVELLYAHLEGKSWPSFLAMVDDFAGYDPEGLLSRLLDGLIGMVTKHLGSRAVIPDRHLLSQDRDVFQAFCGQLLQAKGETPDSVEWCGTTFDLLQQDPADLQMQVVDHVRWMWNGYLAAEWDRHLPILQDSIAVFESLDLSNLTTGEAVRRIIGRDEPAEWKNWREGLDEIIFIPSPHIGPYLVLINRTDTTGRVVFGARIPEGATVHSSALSRSDLYMRLSALADDTRLRILELVALEGEQGAKDIMDRFDLSKSAASRHLRQLTANGYLIVRQQDVSKYYRLNPNRIDETWRVLKAFLQLP
jgi:DNA-binding transcriptional ArsR family regulator